ncbi:MAG: M67 family metallopeptidase [Methylicorpusculum sp.]|uniref:M67 family metallopeptidase n=2 Tax=Methylicorpusculum sp. TaxID=2713644 RepID=UPI00271E2688|nr:M67 family metallopeptidase [Methylicorpusculum sp.]MDO8844565.1 M67 family metallopeptidase [Methylicorpusculum sp.]MDO8938165.1 M67 family metallopeptidase [Methylicorpusculum sp.]MDO9241257.1 M67 family metallopeptidase [Methylicorpusculum sp.]MDP2177879.1 M67 family metallopeptidase [Methylicorpusculum sp.]MDP2200791.1 M67 family metallopeptidase [Methylicorpusculum sp.]
MQPPEIAIPRKITNQLLHLAQLSPDAEICGLISSYQGMAHQCYPIANAAEHPADKFLMEPGQQINAMQNIREKGEELFAIYHSHPKAPAQPSATDLAMAAYPDTLNLIISLNTKGVLEMRGYRIIEQQAREVPLILS